MTPMTDEEVFGPQFDPAKPYEQPSTQLGSAPVGMSEAEVFGNSAIPTGGVTDVPKGGAPTMVSPGSNPVQTQQDATTQPRTGFGKETGSLISPADALEAFSHGVNPWQDELNALVSSTLNGTSFGKAYTASQKSAEDSASKHPGTAAGMELAGGVAQALSGEGLLRIAGLLTKPKTVAQAMGNAFKLGAALGVYNGAGSDGSIVDRAGNAVVGGAIGGAVGGVTAGVLGGAGKAAAGVASMYRGAMNPAKEAGRLAGKAFLTDAATGTPAMTAAQHAQAAAEGQPVMNVDLGGSAVRKLGQTAANASDEASNTLSTAIEGRTVAVKDRLDDLFQGATTGSGKRAFQTLEELKNAQVAANKPAYTALFKANDRPMGQTGDLAKIINTKEGLAALKSAEAAWNTEQVVAGKSAGMNSPIHITDDGLILKTGSKAGQPTYPNLEFWDLAKRELDGQIHTAGWQTPQGRRLTKLKTMMTNALDKEAPAYAATRGQAKSFFDSTDALEAGQKFFGSNMPGAQGAALVAKMTDPERELFKQGVFEKIRQNLANVADPTPGKLTTATAVNKIFRTGKNKEQLQAAFGADYPRIAAYLYREQAMDVARNIVAGYSTTAAQAARLFKNDTFQALAGGALAGEAYGFHRTGSFMPSLSHALSGMMIATSIKLIKGGVMNQRVADHVAELLTSTDQSVVNSGLKAVARSRRLLHLFEVMGAVAGKIAADAGEEPVKSAIKEAVQ